MPLTQKHYTQSLWEEKKKSFSRALDGQGYKIGIALFFFIKNHNSSKELF